jgi:hypothetical protein
MQSVSRGIGPASRCKAALIVRVEITETACERVSGATAAAAEKRTKSGSLLVGACDWPSHQQVWGAP